MSTNGVNTSEDVEMAESDSEKVVTMMDVLKEQEDFEEDANAVLGASDDKDCTYSKGYIKRQAIYACMTCCSEARNDPTKRAGVCLACSLNCHENHELIELYTKRNFRCDCGNPKFNGHPCQFTPNKTEINEDNVYNQNFSGVYCICSRPYPDPEATTEQEMIQCVVCEDWLHSSHLDAVVPANEQYAEMICKACMDKNDFLHDYSDLAVIKENVDVDILNTSTDLNDAKCNGNPIEEKDENIKANADTGTTEKSNNDDIPKELVNMEVENDNVAETKDIEQCNTKQNSIDEQGHESSCDVQNDSKKDEVTTAQETLSSTDDTKENQEITEKKDIEPEAPTSKESDESTNNDEAISTQNLEANDDVSKNLDGVETVKSTQPDSLAAEDSSNKPTHSNDKEEVNSLSAENEIVNEKANEIENIELAETPVPEESSEVQTNTIKNAEESSPSDKQNNIISEDATQPDKLEIEQKDKEPIEEIKPSNESNVDTIENKEETQSSLNEENSTVPESTEKTDNRTQEQVEEDLLLRDPTEPDQGHEENKTKASDVADVTASSEVTDTRSTEKDLENKTKSEAMNTSESIENKKNLESEPELSTTEQKEETTEDKANDTDSKENVTDVEMSENSKQNIENEESLKKDDKDTSNTELSDITTKETDILKRKLSTEIDEDATTKKPKLTETQCIRPKGVKKVHKGAMFWPLNFRQKLCMCNECLSMYKDLSVLFLTDPDDTVTAYERLGQEKTNGEPMSQYEKGMAALSSLGRVQQINALTEYTKMRDKLLDFLKSFKDRKVIVKEEDIKAFFAGMKPVREPDGVYFCR